MKILIIGDIYGKPGLKALEHFLPQLKLAYQPHCIIVNAENAANGRGITQTIYKTLMSLGIHVLTMGNHVFANKELETFIEQANIVRPINYLQAPGKGYHTIHFNQQKILVINALGQAFMNQHVQSPFLTVEHILNTVEHNVSILDFHAEATSEKVALGHYFDGKADIIFGTHTHVQTNDSRILPKGTFYLTDVGMTGPLNGVIGVKKEIVIDRFINGYSTPNDVAEGAIQLNGWFIDTQLKKHELIHLEQDENNL
jgi:metallophosphoesterase (TIGR00282 family)